MAKGESLLANARIDAFCDEGCNAAHIRTVEFSQWDSILFLFILILGNYFLQFVWKHITKACLFEEPHHNLGNSCYSGSYQDCLVLTVGLSLHHSHPHLKHFLQLVWKHISKDCLLEETHYELA